MLLTKSIPQLCPLTFQLRPALNHEDSLSLLQENFLKTQIGEVFPLPSVISRYNTSLFGFREGKQLAKNYTGTRSPRPPSQCLRVPPGWENQTQYYCSTTYSRYSDWPEFRKRSEKLHQ